MSAEYTVTVNGKKYNVALKGDKAVVNGKTYDINIAEGISGSSSGSLDIKAPVAGSILKITASEGDNISEGDVIMIMEAMKMETEIKAASDGTLSSIKVKEGEQVDSGKVLAALESKGGSKASSDEHDSSEDSIHVNAPLPGSVVRLKVEEGDSINEGDTIMVVEAMKMETEIKSSASGIVSTISVAPGDQVQTGQTLAIIN